MTSREKGFLLPSRELRGQTRYSLGLHPGASQCKQARVDGIGGAEVMPSDLHSLGTSGKTR